MPTFIKDDATSILQLLDCSSTIVQPWVPIAVVSHFASTSLGFSQERLSKALSALSEEDLITRTASCVRRRTTCGGGISDDAAGSLWSRVAGEDDESAVMQLI